MVFNNGLVLQFGFGSGTITFPLTFNTIFMAILGSRNGDYFPNLAFEADLSIESIIIRGRHISKYTYSTSIRGDYIVIGI